MAVRLNKACLAGTVALVLAAVTDGAWAQDAQSRSPNGLRGSESDINQPIAQRPASDTIDQPPLPTPLTLAPRPPGDANTQPALGFRPDPSGTINYGRLKPRKPKLYKLYKLYRPDPRSSPPLAPLAPYATAPGLRKKTLPPEPTTDLQPDPDRVVEPIPPSPTVAMLPAPPPPRKPIPDPDPFAPTGIDAGSLRLFPYVESDVGYDTNPNRLSTGIVPSPYLRGEGGLKVESLWSQHSLTADLHGGYSDYLLFHAADRPDANALITGRVDVTRDLKINSESRFSLTTQQPGSPILAVPGSVFITNRPLIMSYGETLGVTQNFNRLQISLRGSYDRYTYADAEQSDGTTLALSTEDYNDYGITGRIGYELTPGLIPFVQLGGDLRRHDDFVDFDGFARDSNGIAIKAGSKFEITQLLTGEMSAGYAMRNYVDPRLPAVNAPTVDGSLIYTVTPLTTVTLKTSTDISETTTPLASAAVGRRVGIDVAHALLRNLTITASAAYQNNSYVGQPITENFVTAGLAAEYKLNRDVVLRASYSYENFHSTFPASNFTANVFLLGLRLQR